MKMKENNGIPPKHLKVRDSFDAKKYKELYQDDIIIDSECINAEIEKLISKESHFVEIPSYDSVESLLSNEHSIKDKVTAPRDETPLDKHIERLKEELDYFVGHNSTNSNHTSLLVVLNRMVDKMKDDGIVWSGRGSSCSSYVLYLIGVHDVNPIKYDIDFTEFTKE